MSRQSAVPRSIMSPLQKEQQSRLNALTSADRDVFDCPICLSKLKENRESPCCNSLFCGTCIRSWYTKSVGTPRCPSCQLPVPLDLFTHNRFAEMRARELEEEEEVESDDSNTPTPTPSPLGKRAVDFMPSHLRGRSSSPSRSPSARAGKPHAEPPSDSELVATLMTRVSELEMKQELTLRWAQAAAKQLAAVDDSGNDLAAFFRELGDVRPSQYNKDRPYKLPSGVMAGMGIETRAANKRSSELHGELHTLRKGYEELQVGMTRLRDKVDRMDEEIRESLTAIYADQHAQRSLSRDREQQHHGKSSSRTSTSSSTKRRSGGSSSKSHYVTSPRSSPRANRRSNASSATASTPPSSPPPKSILAYTVDPMGIHRGKCNSCGDRICPVFKSFLDVCNDAAEEEGGGAWANGENEVRLLQCAHCGCSCAAHVEVRPDQQSQQTPQTPPSKAAVKEVASPRTTRRNNKTRGGYLSHDDGGDTAAGVRGVAALGSDSDGSDLQSLLSEDDSDVHSLRLDDEPSQSEVDDYPHPFHPQSGPEYPFPIHNSHSSRRPRASEMEHQWASAAARAQQHYHHHRHQHANRRPSSHRHHQHHHPPPPSSSRHSRSGARAGAASYSAEAAVKEARAVLHRLSTFYSQPHVQHRIRTSLQPRPGQPPGDHLATVRQISLEAIGTVLPAFGLTRETVDVQARLNGILGEHVVSDQISRERFVEITRLLQMPPRMFPQMMGR